MVLVATSGEPKEGIFRVAAALAGLGEEGAAGYRVEVVEAVEVEGEVQCDAVCKQPLPPSFTRRVGTVPGPVAGTGVPGLILGFMVWLYGV